MVGGWSAESQSLAEASMLEAIRFGEDSRRISGPNPWVGALLESGGQKHFGRTQRPGGPHAEIEALRQVTSAKGSELFVTLEPCSHFGRTPPCASSIVEAGVKRVNIAILDPDPKVFGQGVKILSDGGVDVTIGVRASEAAHSLAPYIKHRSTGRPWVVLKLAMSLDGKVAAPDGSSRWITGAASRAHAHALRADSDVIIVGAGTVRVDDPTLTARLDDVVKQPERIVLGGIPEGAKVLPARSYRGDIEELLGELGERGVLQVLVEGGPTVASEFHRLGLADQYSAYIAPAIFATDRARAALSGSSMESMEGIWRGVTSKVERLGNDVYLEIFSESATELLNGLQREGIEMAKRLGLGFLE